MLACCGKHGMDGRPPRNGCTMGVDTGKDLHVVISRFVEGSYEKRQVLYLGTRQAYSELDELMTKYNIRTCVIDALPEIHATRAFARRHHGRVFVNYFLESQRGSYAWDHKEHIVRENRTEALDASRQIVRDGDVVLPRGGGVIREFASHMAADVKELIEDEETGAKAYRYKKIGTNHYSFAFTYDCIAWSREPRGPCLVAVGSPEDRLPPSILTMEF